MLQIKDICKEYKTGNLVQKALDGVSLNLRDNEFVAILGPSGSGKTTLLNIIGGLDRYDSGDLIINGISTKKYTDRDWDSYRNHTIGFVFQSYNLIPHQNVLSNVELALTISGISGKERRQRAIEALEKVGLGEQIYKKPNQMSGGQMQRVAIARALVNNPDILLADEPTGALDSETSVQVMELLKEVAKDRLVVMVTHNPELAEKYATRIVNLRDGHILSDTDPLEIKEEGLEIAEHKNMGKSSMSYLTALSLSFNNLKTKKARTILTSFAGSIGIIGIAAILSLSNGVNDYIQSIEEETLSEYPLQIQSTGIDMTSMMVRSQSGDETDDGEGDEQEKTDRRRRGDEDENVESDEIHVMQLVTDMFSTMDSNDLESLKEYLDSGESGVEEYANAVEYTYDVTPQIFRDDGDSIHQVNPDNSFSSLGIGSGSSSSSLMSSMMSTNVFYEMPENESLYKSQYDVKAGRWPGNYNECVLVLTASGGISDFHLYTLGLRDSMELEEMIRQFVNEEEIETPGDMGTYTYDDILGIEFKVVNSSDYYQYDSQYNTWVDKSEDEAYMKELVENGETLTIVGIVQLSENANGAALTTGINYPHSLTEHVAEQAEESEIVKKQLADEDTDVFTGETFNSKSSQNSFDMSAMFEIDEAALERAFQFDTNALGSLGDSGSIDLSGAFSDTSQTIDLSGAIDLSSIQISLPSMPQVSMSDLMGSVKLNVSSGELKNLVSGLLEGYQAYAASNPQADYSKLSENFTEYLKTDAAKKILCDHISQIIQANGDIIVSTEQLSRLVQTVLYGYQDYVEQMGYTDADQFHKYLMEYLQTPQAKAILDTWAAENLKIDETIEITEAQLVALASDLAAGYQGYAAENGLADPTKMGDYFMDYLSTADARQKLAEGLGSMIDTGSLQEQVSSSMQGYMQQVMASYGTAMGSALETQISNAVGQMMDQLASGIQTAMQQSMSTLGTKLENAISIDGDAFTDAFKMNMSGEELRELMMSMSTGKSASYDGNLQKLGYADFDKPTGISIYPKDFASKEHIVQILDNYNTRMEEDGKEEKVITYTDMVGTLMSSVTDIIDVVSYVLIAFVAISLVVSSIMIGVITYISVLERRKEIGILRAMGASKRNISQVFNAETFIIGLCAGLMGIGLTLLILIPGNALIHHLAGTTAINATLPAGGAVILILLSVGLTVLSGLLPSGKAAKSDPVTALRSE